MKLKVIKLLTIFEIVQQYHEINVLKQLPVLCITVKYLKSFMSKNRWNLLLFACIFEIVLFVVYVVYGESARGFRKVIGITKHSHLWLP